MNFNYNIAVDDTSVSDTTNLKFPFNDVKDQNYFENNNNSGMYLNNPGNINTEIVYDPTTNEYHFKKQIGKFNYRTPQSMSFEDYREHDFNSSVQDNWNQIAKSNTSKYSKSLIPTLRVGGDVFDAIFGSNTIDIRPQGSAELIFGLKIHKTENPNIPIKNRRTTTFDFDEKIQMNVTGQIGDKMKLATKYDTEATFEFENEMKLGYEGDDDEIIQKIEAGNVSLPLTGSLITGSQSLFGLKTELKFGRLTMATIFSQQKGKKSEINVEGGAQTTEFEIYADEYDANRHFFLAQYFKDNYDNAVSTLPVINSGITITKVEVWVTNKTGNFQNSRNIVAFMDLAEGYKTDGSNNSYIYSPNIQLTPAAGVLPSDTNNTLFDLGSDTLSSIRDITQLSTSLAGFNSGTDYEKIESARLLRTSEYTLHPKLGYIDVNSALNSDEILAVAYEYIFRGRHYRVGEFSTSGVAAPKVLITKLLKGTNLSPKLPTWDLMMKNIYSLGAYQVSKQDFELNVLYQNDNTGTPIDYIEAGDINEKRLVEVLNLDRLDSKNEPNPDGVYDFVDGYTISVNGGKVIFPVLEPFGSYLEKKINNPTDAKKYVYQELYDSTQSKARQIAEKNKFILKGRYKSSPGSDISLNALNVPKGSVTVTSGGRILTEGHDYTVDYLLGRVKIINQGILESGTPIKISLESNSLFSIQSKTLVGTHFNYQVSRDINIGGTILNLTERPITQKVNIGDEPISNTIWGLDGNYNKNIPLLTKFIDKLPFLETKAMSTVTITGEFAHLIPGHSKAIDKDGKAYIDDFEGTKTSIDIRAYNGWKLASTPQKQTLFKESALNNNLDYGKNRAKLAWYRVDGSLTRNDASTPDAVKDNPVLQNNHFAREIYETELFPERMPANNISPSMPVLNLAFYPEERGPYNYDLPFGSSYSKGIDINGNLLDPKTRWGGVMRNITQSDFEEANIEFIEFWLMDPFVYNKNHSGGDLYFNLGNISEDILKDSRKSFEDGLPTDENSTLVDTTAWGIVSSKQSLNNSFDQDEEKKRKQDIGLDGLEDIRERTFFKEVFLDSIEMTFPGSKAFSDAMADPSTDNFSYFMENDFADAQQSIVERYKMYNGLEANSVIQLQVNSTQPDIEDINYDNTLSEGESYYQYKVSLNPTDMVIGSNYITDIRTGENKDGDKVNYYQFRVPIQEPSKIIGDIQDFKSIRFIRMFLHNFDEEVVLRFAELNLVRSDWRKYNFSFLEAGPYIPTEPVNTLFDVTAVNIEENGNKQPVNYVLPVGVTRQIDPMNPQLRELNEQSMVLNICGLQDGDARAAYKNIRLDLRQYKKLQMFIHAEKIEGQDLQDGDVTTFVRIGSDYQNNYYEYEIPLKITPAGTYNKDNEVDRYIVWPDENMLDLELEKLQDIKIARNNAKDDPNQNASYTKVYSEKDGNNTISIKGNPNLSNVRTIMIGVRNPKKENNENIDDGLSKCVEIWVNELRMSNFDEKGGWAANARVTTKLADFGQITMSGSIIKPGFGSLESKVNERHQEEIRQYDLASNLELGKFFSQKSGISIPMYASFSEGIIEPKYNPSEPDITIDKSLEGKSRAVRDSIRRLSLDVTKRRSLNFTNVKINKSKGKPKFYSPSNFSTSYSYNEIESYNYNIESFSEKNYRGLFNYTFNSTPKNFQPFKKKRKGIFKSKYMKPIKDFNLYLMPRQVSFLTNIDRKYSEKKIRNVIIGGADITPTYNKDFNWNRMYDVKWDITKLLKFDFTANNYARIDEHPGIVDKNTDEYAAWKDTVMQSINDLGRNFQYHHQFSIIYTLPINKFPLTDWINTNVRYSGNYDWTKAPRLAPDLDGNVRDLGNTIKNSNTAQINAQANMIRLYNKVPYFKKINQKHRKRKGGRKPKKEFETVIFPDKGEEKFMRFKKDIPKAINHKLDTDDVEVKVVDEKGKEVKGTMKIVTDNKIFFTADRDVKGAKVVVTGKREKKESILKKVVEQTAMTIMGVKNISFTYSQNQGSLLPGYTGDIRFLGMDKNFVNPGWAFITGWQDTEDIFVPDMINAGLLSKDSMLNLPFMMSNSSNLNLRSTLEPLPGLRISIDATKNEANNRSEYYIFNNGEFTAENQQYTGNFSMSFNSWATAFEKMGDDNSSPAFEQLKINSKVISSRYAIEREQSATNVYGYTSSLKDSAGFNDGYSQTSQDVLIMSFLSAYSGKNANNILLSILPKIPSLNWRITFDGLTKIKYIQHYVKTLTVSHAYRSTYNIGSYSSNLSYKIEESNNDQLNWVRDNLQRNGDYINFLPEIEIATVSINEMFAPLIGFDMTLKNGLIAKIELKKSRNLTFSLANNQLLEIKTNEYVIGTGYRIKDLEINITTGGNTNNFKSDLNLRADLSIRDNYTMIRKLLEEGDQITAGQTNTSLKLSADYMLSDKFQLRVFFDRIINAPKTSNGFLIADTNFGVSVRFTLTQ